MDSRAINDMNLLKKIFGEDAGNLINISRLAIRELEHAPVTYSFQPNDEFLEIMMANVSYGMKIYVTELMYRTHIAASISLTRMLRWVEGISEAYRAELFLPFSASCRGFIESTSDGGHTLISVPLTLSENFQYLAVSLSGHQKNISWFNSLEDKLVHFSEARRLSKEERKDISIPKVYQTELPKTYIESTFDKSGADGFYGMYQELCDLTHAGQSSVTYMLEATGQPRTMRLLTSTDSILIEEFVERHRARMALMLRAQVNLCLTSFKVLGQFSLKSLHVNAVNSTDLSNVIGWVKCAKAIGINAAVTR